MGRPRKEFSEKDIEQLKVLARCHCPDSEIAAWFGVGENTIQRHFGALLKESREQGKANIRAKQFRMAMDGDRTMLIWLGKQLLNQRERNDFQHSGPDGKPLEAISPVHVIIGIPDNGRDKK